MADPKHFGSGSFSQRTTTTTAAPIGTSHGTPRGHPGSRAVEDAKEMGAELVGAVRERANSFFEEQRDRAASEIASFAEILRRSARTLDESRPTMIGQYAEDAADEITHFAERLHNRSLGMMAKDVEEFARQVPVGFIVAAVGAGFLAGRFLISSASRSRPQAMTPQTARPMSAAQHPIGGARHDFGSVGGAETGGTAGYGGGGMRETH